MSGPTSSPGRFDLWGEELEVVGCFAEEKESLVL